MAEASRELPEECWAMIFSLLDHHVPWESISLVCKQFLSLTNHLRTSIKVFDPSIQVLPRYHQRFTHLKQINLSDFWGDPDHAILVIAQYGFNLEQLNVSCNRVLCSPHL
ncbi:hypothetical protein Nepgr_017739 [Nepenthes gracilis]|uniref:F-box domain-containing protein n=1 Tax=Nepenthes gracilis TaxID=150966 RepID=A0AAD3XSR9_NEPGR|nr:hypothetical protein Nepgr_017739 [Nepenthes gracilis]